MSPNRSTSWPICTPTLSPRTMPAPAPPLFVRFLADQAGGDTLVIVEAGDLPARAALRRAFDEAPRAAAIGCYPDNARDLAQVIRDAFAAHRIAASRDATDFLVQHL